MEDKIKARVRNLRAQIAKLDKTKELDHIDKKLAEALAGPKKTKKKAD